MNPLEQLTEGIHFITMELVRGKTLTELIPKKGLPLGKFFDIAIPSSDALSAAHQQGITHRDLKPDNVMVSDEGRVKNSSRRYQNALDLRNELEELKADVVSGEAVVGGAPFPMKPAWWPKTLWVAGAVIALLAVAWIAGIIPISTTEPSHESVLRLANPVQVTTAIGVEDDPSWSLDGRTLACESDQSGNWDIWMTQLRGGQPGEPHGGSFGTG